MSLDVSVAPIVTARLMLRPVHPGQAADLWPVLRDPAPYQWIARAPLAQLADVERRLTRIARRTAPDRADQWLNWSVWRRDTGAVIGIVESTIPPSHIAQIAYLFASSIWRHGYAAEAVSAAMASIPAIAFEATIDTRNTASRALAAKLGFLLIETRASDDIINGEPSIEELWRRDCS